MSIFPALKENVEKLENEFSLIPEKRKGELSEVSEYIGSTLAAGNPVNLIFICTHNSRRSHISQLFAQAAAYNYGIENINCFSGGTEATSFNPRAVYAMRKAGFEIEQTDDSDNPLYLVKFSTDTPLVKAFSKSFDDAFNVQSNFAAIMTCSHADEACPLVPGASKRFSLIYLDPKEADDTPEEAERYAERCQQIGREMFYLFSLI